MCLCMCACKLIATLVVTLPLRPILFAKKKCSAIRLCLSKSKSFGVEHSLASSNQASKAAELASITGAGPAATGRPPADESATLQVRRYGGTASTLGASPPARLIVQQPASQRQYHPPKSFP